MIERIERTTMSRAWGMTAGIVVLGVAVSLVAGPAWASDEKSGVQTVYAVTAGKTAMGTETVRIVQADSGAFFASGEVKLKQGKDRVHLISHVQREADGELARYRRVEAGRRGKGLFLFKHEARTRVVGVHTDAKQADFDGIGRSHAWDPQTWHHLAVVAKRLVDDGPVSVPFFDVEARRSGTASFTRTGTTHVTDDKGARVAATVWQVGGGPGKARELIVAARGRLVGVRGDDRAMLIKGWTWDDGTRADAEDDVAAKPRAAGDDEEEDGAGSDAGVGP